MDTQDQPGSRNNPSRLPIQAERIQIQRSRCHRRPNRRQNGVPTSLPVALVFSRLPSRLPLRPPFHAASPFCFFVTPLLLDDFVSFSFCICRLFLIILRRPRVARSGRVRNAERGSSIAKGRLQFLNFNFVSFFLSSHNLARSYLTRARHDPSTIQRCRE